MAGQSWSNWSGSVECTPERIVKPSDLEGIRRAVKDAASAGKRIRVAGTGHSFTDLLRTSEIMFSLDDYSGLEEVDTKTHRATARAGTKLWKLNELLDEAGLAMENLGDINRQSLGGAMGTGTHGTGSRFGCIPSQVEAITLVTASGDVVECSETENREIFKAAQVSLGSLGIIARARLRLLPAYNLRYERKKGTFDEVTANLERWDRETRNFEFYFFPHTESVQLKFLNETKEPAVDTPVKKFFTDVVLENASFGLLSRYCRMFPSQSAAVSRLCAGFVADSVEINRAHRCFSTTRMVRFNEMEFGVPAEQAIDTLREIKEWIVKEKIQVHFPIEFRLVKADDIFLSPAHGRANAFIAVHMYKGMERQKYFDGVQAIHRNHSGRPHWGKLHTLTAKELAPLYPMWDRFHAVRKQLDPKGLFMNAYTEKLFLGA